MEGGWWENTQKDLVMLIKAHAAFRHHYSSIFCSDVCVLESRWKGLETFRPYVALVPLSVQNQLDLSPTFQNVNSKTNKWMMFIHLANVVTGNIFVHHLLDKDKIVLLDSAQLWKVKWPGTFIRQWRKMMHLQPLLPSNSMAHFDLQTALWIGMIKKRYTCYD